MKDNELQFDRSCHVLYSKPCKKAILSKIALHYPAAEREAVWEQVQRQYVDFLSDWRTDLGGRKNFHNGAGGTYDCIAILSYYVACRAVTSFREIEEMEENLILPAFRRLKFVDCNKPFFKKLMYKAFTRAKSLCDHWHDYEIAVCRFDKDRPISYEFTACPASEFAIKLGLCAPPPARTAANATTPSAATRTHICAITPNTATRRATGETGERPPGMLRAAAVVFWGRVWYNEIDQDLNRY